MRERPRGRSLAWRDVTIGLKVGERPKPGNRKNKVTDAHVTLEGSQPCHTTDDLVLFLTVSVKDMRHLGRVDMCKGQRPMDLSLISRKTFNKYKKSEDLPKI